MRRAAGTQVTSALTPQSFDGRRWVGHAINEMRPESLRPAISFHGQRVSSVACPIEAGCRKRSEGKTAATSCPTYAISNVPGFQTARRDTDRKARTAQVRNTVWCLGALQRPRPRGGSARREAGLRLLLQSYLASAFNFLRFCCDARKVTSGSALCETRRNRVATNAAARRDFARMPPDIESRFTY